MCGKCAYLSYVSVGGRNEAAIWLLWFVPIGIAGIEN